MSVRSLVSSRVVGVKARHEQRGAVLSVWLAVGMIFLIVCVGIAVDAGGQAAAEQDARHAARQAARAGGQQVLPSDGGGHPQIDPAAAAQAARAYLASSGYSGTVSITGGTRVTVVVTGARYETKFLGIIGIHHLKIRAEGTSDSVRTLDGVPR